MTIPPAIKDTELNSLISNIKLLRIFYFVIAAFSLLGMLFLFGHYYLMTHIMELAAKAPAKNPQQVDPRVFMSMFKWFYIVFGMLLLLGGVLNVLTAVFLGARKNRMFCMVVGGINCLQVPLGTALGVFTIFLLSKPRAEALFDKAHDVREYRN